MNDSIANEFVEILTSRFQLDHKLCVDNLEQKLTLPPFNLQGIDLAFLFLLVEKKFKIYFTEIDVLDYALETPRQYIDKIRQYCE